VLVAGGADGASHEYASAEVYDPAAGSWSETGSMSTPRRGHVASLLRSGKVLVAGGWNEGDFLSSAELYDPASGTWRPTGTMTTNRDSCTATLSTDGKVLVAGGRYGAPTNFGTLRTAELYDPATEAWTPTAAMNELRLAHTATLLPNGTVLVAGGEYAFSTSTNSSGGMALESAELYDPATGAWTPTSSLATYRSFHTATLLPNGKVLVAGNVGYVPSSELYDPATGTWALTGSLSDARFYHSATLLPNGRVLVAGGAFAGGGANFSTAELYDVGLGFSENSRPSIASVSSPLALGSALVMGGSQFRGFGGGSSGNTADSATDFPVVQLRAIESGQTVFFPATNWSLTSFASWPVWNFPPGFALATVFVNGIASLSSLVNVTAGMPAATMLVNPIRLPNGNFEFSFSNVPGALFTVLTSTDPDVPLSSWTPIGGVTEISPGQFKFSDSQAAIQGRRFYRVRSF